MISMSEKHDVLQKHYYDGLGKQTISKELGISRNTVKKYIAEFEDSKNKLIGEGADVDKNKLIEIMVEKPKYNSANRTAGVVTNDIIDKLKEFIAENERKLSLGIRKQCMNKQGMYETLVEQGFKISYPSMVNAVNKLVVTKNEAFVKQVYEYGEVCEFDWGEVKLEIDGKVRSYRMAIFTSAKGNYRYTRLYRKEQMQHFLDSHVKFFEHIGGVYKTVVYDNMKVAVAKFVGHNEKQATEFRVDKYSTITIEGNRYSVPDMLVGRFVTVKFIPTEYIAIIIKKKLRFIKETTGCKNGL